MNIWNRIFDKITLPSVNTVYMGIGCCMGHYTEITSTNNQQYPCFLNKFPGKKVIILLDPYLEQDLKIQEQLVLVESQVINNQLIRFLENDNLFVFAINQRFNYEPSKWETPEQNEQTEKDIAIIYNIIEICLNKINKTKFILQDYSGRDTTMYYSNLLNSFEHQYNDLLNNILFDVTQNDGGCAIQLDEDMIPTDSLGNFIQAKYLPLVETNNSPILDSIIKYRIDKLCYPLHLYYSKLLIEPTEFKFTDNYNEQIKLLATIYRIEYDIHNKNRDYIIHVFHQLIHTIIQDIVIIKNIDSNKHSILLENINNRNEFIKNIRQFCLG